MKGNNSAEPLLPQGAGEGSPELLPRAAASVIVLRGNPFEVLLLRRHERSTFVPGMWVFPGGALDERDRSIANTLDGEPLTALRICALRELCEESGISLGASFDPAARMNLLAGEIGLDAITGVTTSLLEKLVWTSRWITPVGMPKRYDTWFFLASAGEHTNATPDGTESVEAIWMTPGSALERSKAGDLPMVFPTLRNLEALLPFSSVDSLIASRRGAKVETQQPVLIVENGKKRIVVPDK